MPRRATESTAALGALRYRLPGLALALLFWGSASVAQSTPECGGADAPCLLEDGSYHAALPQDPAGAPIVVFLHGYGGTGASSVRNPNSAKRYTERGYALIAPTGQRDAEERFRNDWGVEDGFEMPRDDTAFIADVVADAAMRFGLDRDRVLIAGFSRGGSMVWDLACARPDVAVGFAAIAGGFWEPFPEDCVGPIHLHHTHGFTDGQVPLEGRAVRFQGVDFVQGNILKGLDIWRRQNGCEGRADTSSVETGDWIKSWTGCTEGSIILHLTTGGHGIPRGWSGNVLDWFEALEEE